MPSIYVAGASAERETIRGYMNVLREGGYTITRDWVACIDENQGVGNPGGAAAHALAVGDLRGVLDAAYLWLVMPTDPIVSIGCWVELGIAITHAYISSQLSPDWPQVIISGERPERTVFTALADQRFETHGEALAYLLEKAAAP